MKTCHCGCGRLNYYGATDEQRRDGTIFFCYREPKVSMYDPIPKELLRNLPPWVGKLQTLSYLLMLPFALALVWVLFLWPLGERMGLWHFPIAPVAAAGSTAGSLQPMAPPHGATKD